MRQFAECFRLCAILPAWAACVHLGEGRVVYVSLRIVANQESSVVMLTLFRQPQMSAERFAEDEAWVKEGSGQPQGACGRHIEPDQSVAITVLYEERTRERGSSAHVQQERSGHAVWPRSPVIAGLRPRLLLAARPGVTRARSI